MEDEVRPLPNDQIREEKLRTLRDVVRRGEYDVDLQKTAEAMIEKASRGRSGSEVNEG